ncbi:MAG: hypothetical protein H7Z37_10490 [Pyrinomonadaceae bacterium]|nr:hypothetical protein [Pyrinomonadaceae bacterium]
MKLRARGNSIRLRLLRGEVARLGETGKISETINFGSSQSLTYTIEISNANEIVARFESNEIIVSLPDEIALDWVENNEVGLSAKQKIDNETVLELLIEKDFVCVQRPDDVDNKDAFENTNYC